MTWPDIWTRFHRNHFLLYLSNDNFLSLWSFRGRGGGVIWTTFFVMVFYGIIAFVMIFFVGLVGLDTLWYERKKCLELQNVFFFLLTSRKLGVYILVFLKVLKSITQKKFDTFGNLLKRILSTLEPQNKLTTFQAKNIGKTQAKHHTNIIHISLFCDPFGRFFPWLLAFFRHMDVCFSSSSSLAKYICINHSNSKHSCAVGLFSGSGSSIAMISVCSSTLSFENRHFQQHMPQHVANARGGQQNNHAHAHIRSHSHVHTVPNAWSNQCDGDSSPPSA